MLFDMVYVQDIALGVWFGCRFICVLCCGAFDLLLIVVGVTCCYGYLRCVYVC